VVGRVCRLRLSVCGYSQAVIIWSVHRGRERNVFLSTISSPVVENTCDKINCNICRGPQSSAILKCCRCVFTPGKRRLYKYKLRMQFIIYIFRLRRFRRITFDRHSRCGIRLQSVQVYCDIILFSTGWEPIAFCVRAVIGRQSFFSDRLLSIRPSARQLSCHRRVS